MQGLPAQARKRQRANLAIDLGPGGPREHYMRARLTDDGLVPFESQDSALLSVLAAADALLIRPPHDPARRAGTMVDYLAL
ncbi:MAG: hypothetical protein AAFY81_11740 [Pseudomonadota bacterium]